MRTLVAQTEVPSVWEVEKGWWCPTANTFVDLNVQVREQELTLQVIEDAGRFLLHFQGGPTGHETYDWRMFDEPLLRSESLCICAGAVNQWPKCTVPMQAVREALGIIRSVTGGRYEG